jgi:hypothetical protein
MCLFPIRDLTATVSHVRSPDASKAMRMFPVPPARSVHDLIVFLLSSEQAHGINTISPPSLRRHHQLSPT